MQRYISILIFILLGSCTKLKSSTYQALSGEYNNLEEALAKPEEVIWLNLSNQGLTELPSEIGQLRNLKSPLFWIPSIRVSFVCEFVICF